MLFSIGSIVDLILVGKLGAASIAGVGTSTIVVMVLMSARWGINVAIRAMLSRFLGAGDYEAANHTAQQSFVFAAIYTLAVGAVGFIFAAPILTFLGLEPDAVAEGAAYMRVQFACAMPLALWMAADGIMYATGDSITPMKINITVRIIHVAFDPFLIFGWWLFPSLGVVGAAVANILGNSAGMIFGLWVLFTGRTILRMTLKNFRFDFNLIWRLIKIGIPASIMLVQRNFSNLVLTRIIGPFGTLAVAAHNICMRMEAILMTPIWGLGTATSVLVGQNLGAKQPGRAVKTGWLAIGLAQCCIVILSAAILFWAEEIIRIFNAEPDLVRMGSVFLQILIVRYLMMGFEYIMAQASSGAGDTLPPMIVNLTSVWVIQIPIAIFLPNVANLGVYGVRWAMVISTAVAAIANAAYFKMGRWKHKKV